MDLKEAFDIIDATLGMFKSFECEIENGVLKDDFLLTRVQRCNEAVVDENLNYEILSKEFYTYVDCDTEYKMFIVDIRPVCTYLVNEWPSYNARRVRKVLNEVFLECLDICEVYLKGIVDVSIEKGYNFYRMYNTGSQDTRNIENVMLDTIHEMFHALGLTEDVESDVEVQKNINGGITEDLANSIDWVKLTKGFDLERIKDIVNTIGKTKKDKKIIVKAIYDAESASEYLYNIPYSVDKLLNNLYKEYDENHRGLLDVSTKTLNLDKLMKQAIDEYMEKHAATDEHIDEFIKDNQNHPKIETEQLLKQIERGMVILANLNDLEELGVDKMLNVVRIFDDQKFYDENKISVLETKVKNWQSETETCLFLMGISIDKSKPFQTQLVLTRMIDKRKALADEVQMGLRYLRSLIDNANNTDAISDSKHCNDLNVDALKEQKRDNSMKNVAMHEGTGLSEARQSKLEDIVKLLQNGSWKSPATTENIAHLLNVVFGKEVSLLDKGDIPKSEEMWALVEKGRGNRMVIVPANLAGFFIEENLLNGSPKEISNSLFGSKNNQINNINKGKKHYCSKTFIEVIPYLKKYISKIIRQV